MSLYGEDVDSVTLQKENSAVMYVGSGMIISGSVYIVNATVVEIADPSRPAAGNNPSKSNESNIVKQISTRKSKQEKALKKLQQKLNRQVQEHLYPLSTDHQLTRLDQFHSGKSMVYAGNFHQAAVANYYFLHIVHPETAKQKFFTSISFHPLNGVLNAYLRGPPKHFLSSF